MSFTRFVTIILILVASPLSGGREDFGKIVIRWKLILLTGHVRTFDLTAPTLDEFLIKANPTYTFSIFCATYQEREAHAISSRQGKTEQRSLNEDELCDVLREWGLSVRGLYLAPYR